MASKEPRGTLCNILVREGPLGITEGILKDLKTCVIAARQGRNNVTDVIPKTEIP